MLLLATPELLTLHCCWEHQMLTLQSTPEAASHTQPPSLLLLTLFPSLPPFSHSLTDSSRPTSHTSFPTLSHSFPHSFLTHFWCSRSAYSSKSLTDLGIMAASLEAEAAPSAPNTPALLLVFGSEAGSKDSMMYKRSNGGSSNRRRSSVTFSSDTDAPSAPNTRTRNRAPTRHYPQCSRIDTQHAFLTSYPPRPV